MDAGERIRTIATEVTVKGWMAGPHGIETAVKESERLILEFVVDEIRRDRESRGCNIS